MHTMKELAEEIHYANKEWWVWFVVYEVTFSVLHLESDGPQSLRIQRKGSSETGGVTSEPELAEFVRRYAAGASVDDDQVFEDVYNAVMVAMRGSR